MSQFCKIDCPCPREHDFANYIYSFRYICIFSFFWQKYNILFPLLLHLYHKKNYYYKTYIKYITYRTSYEIRILDKQFFSVNIQYTLYEILYTKMFLCI